MGTKKLIILYGSQTGNSQDLAERIWRKAKQFEIDTRLSSFDQFDLNNLFDENINLLCICSTTGQGDMPDNMTKFWKFIMRKNIPTNLLINLKFFMIGLGDSSYEKFNFTAKKLFKRFIQLGANSQIDLCLCDDQHSNGIEAAYSRWITQFWETVNSNFDLKANRTNKFIHKYKIVNLNESNKNIECKNEPADEISPFYAKLVRNERSTDQEHWQNVRLLEFDCNTSRIKYEPGDVLVLRPSNLKQNIEKFMDAFKHLNLDLKQRIKIASNYIEEIQTDNETNENLIQTVGDLIEKYFDLNSMPRMSFFELLADLSDDETEKEKLQEFLSPEGQEDLYNYCYRPRRSIIEVFHDFPKTCKCVVNLETLLDLIPSIKPRSFSIASSPFVHKDKIQLLVAVVEYKTRLYEPRRGTCSYWLSSLDPMSNIHIPVWIKKGTFKLDFKKPLICVGPGTGVAPFRSIINERIFKYQLKGNNLYFGCRSRTKDFYFEKEWESISKDYEGYLSVYPAFSRDQEEKVYVQDLMLKESELVFDLIHNQKCLILIAGNSKRMPEDVIAILEKIIANNVSKLGYEGNENDQNFNAEELAKNYIKNLATQNRLQLETWS